METIFILLGAAFGLMVFNKTVTPSKEDEKMEGYESMTISGRVIPWGKYDFEFKRIADMYSIPWYWLKGIALNESLLGADPRVASGQVSSDGKSYGLMQVTMTTAADIKKRPVTPDELKNDAFSIDLAARYLKTLMKMFGGDEKQVIMSYNQGPGNTLKGKSYAGEYYERYKRWVVTMKSKGEI